jgi:purine/pyrimidine-nucleoside phosphorylase
MPDSIPPQFDNVSIPTKANVYFDGRVISHTVIFKDGTKKTLGLIYPGTFKFTTGAPERMDITAGSCRYRLSGHADWTACAAPGHFEVPGDSSFEIAVEDGVTEYVCSFG